MNNLLIDTSGKTANVFLYDDNGSLLNSEQRSGEKSHSVNLIEMIDNVTEGKKGQAFDNVVVVNGPGSYTGLRIAIATAQFLSFSMEKNLFSVNTLDFLANYAAIVSKKKKILSLIDARKGQCFYAFYENNDGKAVPSGEYNADDIENIIGKIDNPQEYCFAGTGALANKEIILKHFDAVAENCIFDCTEAVIMAKAMKNVKICSVSPDKINAYYLRSPHLTIKEMPAK